MLFGLVGAGGLAPAVASIGAGARVAAAGDELEDVDALVVAVPPTPAVRAFAERGGPVLCVGEGFRAACSLGLLEGEVDGDGDGAPEREAFVRVEGRPAPFTWAIPAGRILRVRVAGGRYRAARAAELERDARVALRLCSPEGAAAPAPDVAGVLSRRGNLLGTLVIPHGDGRWLLACAAAAVRGGPSRVGER